MPDLEPFMTIRLDDGRAIQIFDRTRNYFGDYHLVQLEIVYQLSVATDPAPDRSLDSIEAGSSSGDYRRVLEKMAVPSAKIEAVRQTLLDDFFRSSLPYMKTQLFAKRLQEKLLAPNAARKRTTSTGF